MRLCPASRGTVTKAPVSHPAQDSAGSHTLPAPAGTARGHSTGPGPGLAPVPGPAPCRSLAGPVPWAQHRPPPPAAAGAAGRSRGAAGSGARPAVGPGAAGGPVPENTLSLLAPRPNTFFLPSGIVSPTCQPQPGLWCFLPCFLQTVTWHFWWQLSSRYSSFIKDRL